jgi:hypothetical protein
MDPILTPWAAARGLYVATRHHNFEVRSMPVVDDSGDIYQLFATPELDDPHAVIVGAALIKRGTKKHTFSRERRNFDYRTKVSLDELESGLDTAWKHVQLWIEQAGHTRTPV